MKRIARRIHKSCEKGQAVESVLIFPLVLAIVFLIIQAGIWAHARNIALASAREGATISATYRSGTSATAATRSHLNETSSGFFTASAVTATKTSEYVEVHVEGRALSLIPLFQLPQISADVRIPIERYTP
ncbi:TadE family protein [Dermabacteraceae bacterium CCM 9520]